MPWVKRPPLHPFRPCTSRTGTTRSTSWIRQFSSSQTGNDNNQTERDSRSLEPIIQDDFAHLRSEYISPKHPIVLAHGLLGFDELRLAGKWLPGVHYWRGIKEAMNAHNISAITTSVPTTGSIEERARALHQDIKTKAQGQDVNIVAHSMGGLDARYLISRLQPTEFKIKSLTTIATPHRGSSVADMLFRDIGDSNVNGLYSLLARLKFGTGAFAQLTKQFINESFNPACPNDPAVRYFSYGAAAQPHLLSVFRLPHDLLEVVEGPNDGLVSVESSKWGTYKGTLMDVTHLDLINWTNRFKRMAATMSLITPNFNAMAFYLAVADELAKEGL